MTREIAKQFMLQFNTDKRLNAAEHEAIRVAIRVLEQEPIEDVLEDIKTEIDGAKMPKNRMSFFRDGIECALEIIDKYKAERSEEWQE